jgi:predicted ATP-grasp superfamily ATP-dependent carboligase
MNPRVTIHMTEVPKGLPMIHAFSGFVDAGHSIRQAVSHLTTTLPHQKVAELSIDDIYDYRARRPVMTFDRDHFSDVDMPRLSLDLFWDDHSKPFLLMHGPEPDLGWQEVTQVVIELAENFKVGKTVGLQAIPWPAPHTRDLLVTPHASDPTMVEPRPSPVDRVEVPGSLTTLIEFATGRAGIPAQGFAVHIPHYLVNTDYPTGAITVLDELGKAAGLAVDHGDLPRLATEVRAEIDESIASTTENQEVVEALEQQHDAEVATWPGQLPSGDELMDQIEQFLAGQDDED